MAVLLLIFSSCSRKPSAVSNANNTEFNTRFKNQQHILPIRNLLHVTDNAPAAQESIDFYFYKRKSLAAKYQENADYFDFVSKNDFHDKMRGITIESLPKENYEYIKLSRTDSRKELNKLSQVEIDYIFFIKQAVIAKTHQEYHGDPIIHPYTYKSQKRTDRHIVMGDEYHKWNSVCDVGVC